MNYLKSPKAIAALSTTLFFASLFWIMDTRQINGSLQQGLEKQRLASEELLSEKLLLEKDIQKIKEQLRKVTGENSNLTTVVNATQAKLDRQEAEFNRMKKENTSLAQLKKQRVELLAIQTQLHNELQSARRDYDQLVSRNNELTLSVAELQERNRMLVEDLNRAAFASIDQSQIQALKGKKEKLTIRAARTQKLAAEFEIPATMKSLSFRIVDQKGAIVSPKEGAVAFTTTPSEKSYVASSSADITGSQLQNVKMSFVPKQKLKSGIYTVEILNENLYVSSLKVKLK